MIGRGQQIVSDIIKSGPSDHKLLSTLLSKKKKKKKKKRVAKSADFCSLNHMT